jgi:hypothetical protein
MGNARQKLNIAYLNGSVFVAVVFGAIAESWIVFGITLAVLIGCAVYGGEIRTTAGKR